jgi:hypothetical protein
VEGLPDLDPYRTKMSRTHRTGFSCSLSKLFVVRCWWRVCLIGGCRPTTSGACARLGWPRVSPTCLVRVFTISFRAKVLFNLFRVADPDPDLIRIQSGQWILIRNPEPDSESGSGSGSRRAKMTPLKSLKPWIRIGSGSGLAFSLKCWIRIRMK